MKKICVVGSLSYDLVMKVPRRPQKGETIIGSSFNTFVGGKGNNQALAAGRSGASVYMIGKVGKDSFGDQIEAKLKESLVDTKFLYRDDSLGTGIADILVDADGDNSISIAPQANSRLSPADIEQAEEAIKQCSYMLLQLEIPMQTVLHAAKMGKKLGLTVVLNPAPAPENGKLSDELLGFLDIIIPNQTEAELLTGVKVVDIASALEAAKHLQAKGLKQVIITMGEMGALLVNDASVAHMTPAFEVEVHDTTAAGDAFCGALLSALAEEKEMEEALKYACAAGALATCRLGAEPSLPQKAQIKALVESREPCPSN
ncbi:MAG: ribokinase [Candidatus Obscuribacterales bacterium]|nr:ribokinase [Candidatus Obscuribacterales bacterium]